MKPFVVVPIDQVRVGMFIQLDLGWMQHPFPVGSFRVASEAQIDILRSLDLESVRYLPAKSDPAFQQPPAPAPDEAEPANGTDEEPAALHLVRDDEVLALKVQLQAQHDALAVCDERFLSATRTCLRLGPMADKEPLEARSQGESLVSGCVDEQLDNGESVIRLLSEGVGERSRPAGPPGVGSAVP